jgi:GTPase SAR1 family protein
MIKEEDLEIGIKLVIVGNGGVGKSSLIQRYCRGVFTKGE